MSMNIIKSIEMNYDLIEELILGIKENQALFFEFLVEIIAILKNN